MDKFAHSGLTIIVVTITRRLYALLPIGLGLFNVLSTIDGIAQGLGTFSADNVACESDGQATVTCPVTTSNQPAYAALFSIWIIYFGFFFMFHLIYSFQYSPYDLRYFISLLHANTTYLNRLMIAVGHTLTVVTVLVGIYYTNQYASSGIDISSSIRSLVVFAVLNVLLISPFSSTGYFEDMYEIRFMDSFPNAIHVPNIPKKNNVFNFYGAVVSVDEVFSTLNIAAATDYLGKTDHFAELGDFVNIQHAMRVLMKLEFKSEPVTARA